MKRFLSICSVLVIAQFMLAKMPVKGFVVDVSTKEPLVGVSVYNPESSVGITTALDGSFKLNLPEGKNNLVISYVGYTTKKINVPANSSNLGNIALSSEDVGLKDVVVSSSLAIRRKTPVALSVLDATQIEVKLGTQEFPEVLKSTPGVYATKQGGGYGDSRINVRGFEAPNIAVMINGVPMNDMEWGGIYWSNWGALSDVTRSMQVQRGLGASKVAAPSLGGTINVVTRSTDAVKGGSASYGIGNDGFTKVGFSVSTGLSPNKWAITLLGSKTVSDGYIQGTEYEAYSYFVNIAKLISPNQQISLTAFSAPQWHNQRNSNDKLLISEWQKQPLKYKYNPSYGFDMNGQRKQSAYNYYNKPQISLNHLWTVNDNSSLSTAVYLSLGNGGGWGGQGTTTADRNNWYGVPTGTGIANGYDKDGNIINNFRNVDGTFNYAAIYDLNKPSVSNPNGSKMVMSTAINKHVWVGALSTYTTKIGQNIDIYGGVDLRYYKGTHTNEITDLYGGKFFVDVSSIPTATKQLGVGDVVYRDYDGYIVSQGLFGQAEYNNGGLSAFVSLSGSNTLNWRYDRYYYDAANARSKTASFKGYSAKGGINIDSHQNIFGNFGVISRAPFFSGGVFLQAQTNNALNPDGINEKAISAELGYGFRSKYFTANLNVYRTNWIDKTMVVTATNRDTQAPLAANLQGVDALHRGIEFDFVAKPSKDLEITGMASIADWTWQHNATGYLYDLQGHAVDANGVPVEFMSADHAKVNVNLEGIHVGNSAQTTAALGFSYQVLQGFRMGLDGNYFGRNYSSFKINQNLGNNDFQQPWMIPDAVTVDFNANYRFKIGTFDSVLTGNIFNLLDQDYIADAADGSDHTWKTAQVMYGFGRTWSMNLKIKF